MVDQWERSARFCPLCGGPLVATPVEGRDRKKCGACRFVLYENPAPAAAALVLKDREILLTRRGIRPHRGSWTLPAGYEEADEAPADTAVRETLEETGLMVRPFGLYDVLHTDDDPRKRAILIVYLCEVVGGELSPGDDALDARFFPLDALPEEIGFRNNRAVLNRLAKEVQEGRLTYVSQGHGS
ncbi:MAG: NUDIX hydrolase [Planctomycetota bacterium]